MLCTKCGSEFPDTSKFCTQCGSPIADETNQEPTAQQPAAPPAPPAPPPPPTASTAPADAPVIESTAPVNQEATVVLAPATDKPKALRKPGLIIAIAVFALILLGIGGYAAWNHFFNASLLSLVPQGTIAVATVDSVWGWKESADFRQQGEMADAIREMEQDMGISLENDLFSWTGQVGVALMNIDKQGDNPQAAAYIQIRDKDEFLRNFAKMQEKFAEQTNVKWRDDSYRRVKIRRITIEQQYGNNTEIATAMLNGWIVIALGDKAIESVIDVQQRRTPSLANDPSWQRAMSSLPSDQLFSIGIDGKAVSLFGDGNPEIADMLNKLDVDQSIVMYTISEKDAALRMEIVGITSSKAQQARTKKIRDEIGTISNSALKQLPVGTIAALTIANPGAMLKFMKEQALETAPDSSARESIKEGFARNKHLEKLLQLCDGDNALGLAWRKGDGFGIVASLQAKSADNATEAAKTLETYAKENYMTVERKGALYKLPDVVNESKVFNVLPCWSASNKELKLSMHPDWLTSGSSASLKIPSDAGDANILFIGDFSSVSDIQEDWKNQQSLNYSDQYLIDEIGKAADYLDNIRFSAWVTIEPKGDVQHLVIEIENWRDVVKKLTKPDFSGAREKARMQSSINNLKQIVISVQIYAQDNYEKFPNFSSPESLFDTIGLLDSKVFISPRTKSMYQVNYSLSSKNLLDISNPTETIVAYEDKPVDGKRCVAYVDGHVESIDEVSWREESMISGIE